MSKMVQLGTVNLNSGGCDVESRVLAEAELSVREVPSKLKDMVEKDIEKEIDMILREIPRTGDVDCGFWIFKGTCLQRFATQTTYVMLYGLVGCVFSMTYAYFNGTLTTIEKRFKIPSKNTGIISIGNNISQMIVSAVLSYYAGKGHRPRWIGFGVMTIVIFCILTAAPHFFYGPGEDALALTAEFGGVADENTTLEVIEQQRAKMLCRDRNNGTACEIGEGNWAPQVVLFTAQVASGVGGALYYTLGISYMDDNTKKAETPVLLSISYFFHMLGPAIGYALASFCLRIYIAPHLRPVINTGDPRWLGAWWIGWLLLGIVLFICGILFTMLPKELPHAKVRRLMEERTKREIDALKPDVDDEVEGQKASFSDMLATFKRLVMNKTLMHNNVSSVFYYFGYTPYWIFTPKYIEIQYRQSAATSSMVTGTIALAFSAIGVLLSGLVISKCKPKARYMAAWNVIVGVLTMAGCCAYASIGCPDNEHSMIINIPESGIHGISTCSSACGCDYVPFSPVCGENNMTYISPCHAGCKHELTETNGRKIYHDCSCIVVGNPSQDQRSITEVNMILKAVATTEFLTDALANRTLVSSAITFINNPTPFTTTTPSTNIVAPVIGGQATPGACPVNCFTQFVIFLTVMCCLKFVGATGRASNLMVSIRCVSEKDKTAAMGFGMMTICMFTFIPSPIFFGWLLDRLCLVWGKTCNNQGNCWLYDPRSLRYILNFTAAAFIFVGTLFDIAVWYYVKDLQIFDDEQEEGVQEENVMLFEGKAKQNNT